MLTPTKPRQRLRYASLTASPAVLPHDFSTGVPDYDLLPSLTDALRRIGDARLTTSYLDEPVLPGLEAVLRERWPFPPQQLTVVDGALDALDRVTATVVRFGDHVLVENPTFPPLLDLLRIGRRERGRGAGRRVRAATRRRWPRPSACRPVAVFLQPRAHNPTGASMTQRRADALARALPAAPGRGRWSRTTTPGTSPARRR